jgi:glyoxylase-like metal-dependent hydrolase (beta-lactamase superfamily II)
MMTNSIRSPRRFAIGAIPCTVVSDGTVVAGTLEETLVDAHVKVPHPYARAARVSLEVNLLVLESHGSRVLFDAGAGSSADLGSARFGAAVGRAPEALRRAGIGPETIDVVALSHAHPDHAWGLIAADDDRPSFPNATVVIGRAELEYWTSSSSQDDELRDGALRSLRAYEHRVTAIDDGDTVTAAITARETPGHSPGHVVYEIADGDDRLVCWGDICHHPVLLTDPTLSFVYDHDPGAAVRSRLDLLEQLATHESDVLAYHLPFPGLGRVTRSSAGGFAWRPRRLSGLDEDRNTSLDAPEHSDCER